MLSFKQMLDGPKKQAEDDQNMSLFTKLKLNVINKPLMSKQYSLQCSKAPESTYDKLMKDHQLQFEILKLEKANYVASQHRMTGKPIRVIIKEMMAEIQEEIWSIIQNKSQNSLKETKASALQSTFGNTDGDTSVKKEQSSGSCKRAHHTPKIVEFTLGNRELSSNKSNLQRSKDEEVSEFFVNSKGLVSKSIRQKVMGHRNLKQK